ncbi:hypothetical protein HYT45_02555 [Candidatus Uhrbacteria bacterium]|nr:hypothetical protein [Candidatus Uhrbacteria bacterium]
MSQDAMPHEAKPEMSAGAPATPAGSNTLVLRIPKVNMQAALLGLVALITVFQTVQLFRLSNRVGPASAKAASVSSPSAAPQASSSNADVPESMVGGC